MSVIVEKKRQIRIPDLFEYKRRGQKISMVTCYDYTFSRIIAETDIHMILVGDSLGQVVLGYEDTTQVNLEEMIHHCSAVKRGLGHQILICDMPFMTYQLGLKESMRNVMKVMQKGGAHAVKLEGCSLEICELVRKLSDSGVPVMGHLGLTPQKIHSQGGYKVQGKQEKTQKIIMQQAYDLAEAGVFAIVLEMIPRDLAKKISSEISVPTIGIGAGGACDGQVLVLYDLLGVQNHFHPKFLKKYSDLHKVSKEALNLYFSEVERGVFPDNKHSFGGEINGN